MGQKIAISVECLAAGTYVRAVLYLFTFGRRTCADSTTPSYLAVSGGLAGGVRGKRDLRGCFYHLPWQLLGGEAWLEGLLLRLALAGPAGDLKNALLRRRLGCLLPTVPDPHRKKKKKKTDMERSGSTPSALRRASLPGGSGTGGAPTAAAESHRCWTAAGTYVRAGLYLHTFGRRTRADSTTPSYLAVSGGLVRGMRDLRGCFYHLPWQLLGGRLGWKDCCCGWLLLDLLAISKWSVTAWS